MALRPTVVAIVDDDPGLLESLGDLLESAGYVVRAFSSGASFLDEARLAEIDCLVTDVGMPAIGGYELRRLVIRERPDLPVVFITGNPDWIASARPEDLSCGRHFQKPFSSNALVTFIAETVRRKP